MAADSFAGVPPPRNESNPSYANDTWHTLGIKHAYAVSLEEVQSNFEKFGLLDSRVKFVKGYFNVSLRDPSVQKRIFSLIRLDGDTYESTLDVLTALYPLLTADCLPRTHITYYYYFIYIL